MNNFLYFVGGLASAVLVCLLYLNHRGLTVIPVGLIDRINETVSLTEHADEIEKIKDVLDYSWPKIVKFSCSSLSSAHRIGRIFLAIVKDKETSVVSYTLLRSCWVTVAKKWIFIDERTGSELSDLLEIVEGFALVDLSTGEHDEG